MKFFGLGKKDKILDLTERYKKQQEKIVGSKENSVPETIGFFGNFPAMNDSNQSDSNIEDERKKKLAKRLMDITSKMEEISNQIYHLQQRLEVVERKLGK